MNWYKKSQQEQLPLPGFPKTNAPIPVFGQEPKTDEELFSGDPTEDIKWSSPPLTIDRIIEHYDIPYEIIDFPKYDDIKMPSIMVLIISENKYIIDDLEDQQPSIKEASEWVDDISDLNLDFYLPEKEAFWDGVGDGFVVYHATNPDNIESIKKHGLKVKNESRGLSNRGTPSAIFTSTEEAEIESYGTAVVVIDVGKMKKDGFMPRVEMEEPVVESEQRSSIAWRIGLQDYSEHHEIEQGISTNTIIFFDNIPPQYLAFK